MFVPLSLPLGEEELGLLPTCYTQGTASIIVICSSEWLRHAAILGPIPRDQGEYREAHLGSGP